ncbi:hypothetical protein V6N13_037376 [Hibiscus sabdariffa]
MLMVVSQSEWHMFTEWASLLLLTRNARDFGSDDDSWGSLLDHCRAIQWQTIKAERATQQLPNTSFQVLNGSHFWTRPDDDWVKMNTDGSHHVINGVASHGGVLRDSTVQWLLGYHT